MPGASIAGRLAWTQLATTLLWSAAVSLAVWLTVHEEVGELLDDTLREAAYIMAPGLSGPALPPLAHQGGGATDSYAWQVVVYPPAGGPQVLAHSAQAPHGAYLATPTAGFVDLPDWHVYGAALGSDGRMLYVAQQQQERFEAVLETSLNAALATLAVSLLAHLWLRARTTRELAPLINLSDRLARHDLLAPGATLGPPERSELAPMHAAIDTLAAQLRQRLAQERAFSAHAAQVTTPAQNRLRLQDDGPGVDATRRHALQAAVDEGDAAGHTGLGLVLASLVARAHGGALTLPAVGAGFAVELSLTELRHG